MNSAKQEIERLFEEIGVRCPNKLAAHLGDMVYSGPELDCALKDDVVCGMYLLPLPSSPVFIINSSMQLEDQELTLIKLLLRHFSNCDPCALVKSELDCDRERKFRSPTFIELKSMIGRALEGAFQL